MILNLPLTDKAWIQASLPIKERWTCHPFGDLAGTSRLPGFSHKHRFAPLALQTLQRIILDPLFTPLALETLCPINCEGLSFVSELGQKLRATTGEMCETAFLFQRISIAIQRFNAVAFRKTFLHQDTDKL